VPRAELGRGRRRRCVLGGAAWPGGAVGGRASASWVIPPFRPCRSAVGCPTMLDRASSARSGRSPITPLDPTVSWQPQIVPRWRLVVDPGQTQPAPQGQRRKVGASPPKPPSGCGQMFGCRRHGGGLGQAARVVNSGRSVGSRMLLLTLAPRPGVVLGSGGGRYPVVACIGRCELSPRSSFSSSRVGRRSDSRGSPGVSIGGWAGRVQHR